jgi:prefoldin alpha subunit
MADEKNPKEQRPLATTLEEFRYLQQLYQNQYMSLAQELNGRMEMLKQLDTAQKTLEDIDSIKERDALVPVGYGTFAKGRILGSDTVMLSIGAGFMVEKSIAEAEAHIAKALDGETKYINKLNKSKRELESALTEISYKIEELSH